MADIEGALRRIGLTRGEVKVYTALLELGPSTSGPIRKRSGISGSKVYPILDRLMSMGLASYIKRGERKVFQPAQPAKMLELLEKRRQEIEGQEAEIRGVIPGLMRMQGSMASKREAMIYEGHRGVKTYYKSLLDSMKSGEERLVFGARSGYPISKGAQYFFRSYHRDWVKKGLRTRIIFNSDLRASRSVQPYAGSRLTQVRYLPHVTLSSIGIQGDMVDMLVWTKETALVFAIRSKEVARTFRGYFEVLWRNAKE